MEIYITHVRLSGGQKHEHITHVKWVNRGNGSSGESSREAMVEWLEKPGNHAYVEDASGRVEVGVVKASPPYIRTHKDGRWTDNLLALPRF